MTAVRALRIAAGVEAVSLVVLLANLATAHLSAISSLCGPLHGTAYLVIIVLTLMTPPPGGGRWRAFVPGIGGLLVLRMFPKPQAVPDGREVSG